MKQSLNSDRENEYNRQYAVEKAWNISLKYSKLLLKKNNNNNLDYNYCCDTYNQYIIELKSNRISLLKKKIYIQQWDNFMNTLNKNYFKVSKKNHSNIINSIYNLYYTSFIRN